MNVRKIQDFRGTCPLRAFLGALEEEVIWKTARVPAGETAKDKWLES